MTNKSCVYFTTFRFKLRPFVPVWSDNKDSSNTKTENKASAETKLRSITTIFILERTESHN